MVKIEREIDQLEMILIKMGNKVIKMHSALFEIYESSNREQALAIIQADNFVNNMEGEINDMAISVFALLSPVASDLRRVITVIKIASEFERIADYAKNIASFIIKADETEPNIMGYAKLMEEHFLRMLEAALQCYENKDADLAFEIPALDQQLDDLFNECISKTDQDLVLKKPQEIFKTFMVLRNLERAGDHVTNICEQIIYCVKGQQYDLG